MIFPNEIQNPESVALHYNSLDPWYLKLWGGHVHHGLWKTGKESSEKAVEQLVERVAEALALKAGDRVCDIGCGYGGTSRLFSERWGAQMTGFTLSVKQAAYAREKDVRSTYHIRDFLHNELPSESFDAAISIESSEHMVDKESFFKEAFRILKPQGRIAVCAWLSKEHPKPWEVRLFLEPICREGRLPSMGSPSDYIHLMQNAGFKEIRFEDISSQVKRTWAICGWRVIRALGQADFRRFLLKSRAADRVFAKTIFRILGAYQTRSMIYGIFSAYK
jgi:tocopherol O-methyltransferase